MGRRNIEVVQNVDSVGREHPCSEPPRYSGLRTNRGPTCKSIVNIKRRPCAVLTVYVFAGLQFEPLHT